MESIVSINFSLQHLIIDVNVLVVPCGDAAFQKIIATQRLLNLLGRLRLVLLAVLEDLEFFVVVICCLICRKKLFLHMGISFNFLGKYVTMFCTHSSMMCSHIPIL
jgi:hypothetical protein